VSARLAPSAVVDDRRSTLSVRRRIARDLFSSSATFSSLCGHRVLPDLGGGRLSEIRRVDLQDFADRLRGPREC